MINLLQALMLWWSCSAGQPIPDFATYVAVRNYDLGAIVAQARIETTEGPVTIWQFEHTLFVTRPSSLHGQCARELP